MPSSPWSLLALDNTIVFYHFLNNVYRELKSDSSCSPSPENTRKILMSKVCALLLDTCMCYNPSAVHVRLKSLLLCTL